MSNNDRQLLSIGVFLILFVVGILLAAAGIIGWFLFVPAVVLLFGCWVLALAAMRSRTSQKYERSAFNTFASGLCLIAVGGAFYLFEFNWLYSVALILLVIAALAIAAALKRK
jgi:hypothetical protein